MDFDDSMDKELRTVWCGNISDRASEEILYELFLQAGPLEQVQIPKDKYGKKNGYAFIIFKHVCSVEYALSLFEKIILFDRELNLKPRRIPQSVQMTDLSSLRHPNMHNKELACPPLQNMQNNVPFIPVDNTFNNVFVENMNMYNSIYLNQLSFANPYGNSVSNGNEVRDDFRSRTSGNWNERHHRKDNYRSDNHNYGNNFKRHRH